MHRLFVAIRPPEDVRDLLLDTMEGLPALRWQDDEQLHLTLRFIGEVERPLAEDIAAALGTLRFTPFHIRVAGVGRFDHHQRGALWAGVEPRAPIAALAAKVERICVGAGLAPERRAYHPHITLARWGRGAGNSLDPFLARHAALRSKEFEVAAVTLFESRLGRDGAHYETVADYPPR
ncbi:MAG: RNA 2',3'-cyclic phosphodiesterase [Pseudomonadota bacterium]|nr:RNA 2',3'-cyclic phosphodiesterase [Pseudomonadota bacterium]